VVHMDLTASAGCQNLPKAWTPTFWNPHELRRAMISQWSLWGVGSEIEYDTLVRTDDAHSPANTEHSPHGQ
jgi:hypothetical protein